jgi:UDP-N-acetylmuramoylalanine--D-glutamate ligase
MGFDPKAFKKKTAGVLGLGKSGRAAAKLLSAKGFKVLGSDSRPRAEVLKALGPLAKKISWEGGKHTDRLLKCSLIVKSPGLSPSLPILRKAREKDIPVFSEMEIGLAYSKTRDIVAITGTNGKTTTTTLTAEIFKAAGKHVVVCGNIGQAFCDEAVKTKAKSILVAETSSYQLEDSSAFHPRAAAVLNVTADHIDHHGSMGNYLAAKGKAFVNMGPGDFGVFNAADPLCMRLARTTRAKALLFGLSKDHARLHSWYEEPNIIVQLWGKKPFRLRPPKLPGRHNLENAMAAALLAASRGVKPAAIQKAFNKFKGVEHRLEECGTIAGLRCVNDSKATNVDSTMVALRAFAEAPGAAKNIFLILGGLHKGGPYTPLRGLVEKVVKAILTIGSAARKIDEDLGGAAPIFPCVNLATAVETAFKIAGKGEILLLSPACASFDQFKDYEDRGRRFKALAAAQR